MALQGCLFGSVALFVALLLTMIFLAWERFRDFTDDSEPSPPASSTPALRLDG